MGKGGLLADIEFSLMTRLKTLAELDGVSGQEQIVASCMGEYLQPHSDKVWADYMGNVYARKAGERQGLTLMVAAHSDEIGGLVKSIEPGGFIRFSVIGWRADILQARKVRVGGVPGVIGSRPGHFPKGEPPEVSDLYIDVGASSDDEVRAMGIEVGSSVTAKSEIEPLAGSRVMGKAIDNRLGCAVLAELFARLEGASFAGNVVGVVTVQEEINFGGARVSAFQVDPDMAIVVDTMPCGDTPDVCFHKELPVGIGKGPVLQLMSSQGPDAYLINPRMKQLITRTASEEEIPYQMALVPFSNTDAAVVHLARGGIPTGVVSIPRRYSHTPVEVCDLKDAAHGVNLLLGVVSRMGDWN